MDDLLDFTGDPKVLGKPAASDLREGKATLAVIELLAGGSIEARELATRVMESGSDSSPEIAQLTTLLHDSGVIEHTRQRARLYADRALEALERFDDSPARMALVALPELLLERDR